MGVAMRTDKRQCAWLAPVQGLRKEVCKRRGGVGCGGVVLSWSLGCRFRCSAGVCVRPSKLSDKIGCGSRHGMVPFRPRRALRTDRALAVACCGTSCWRLLAYPWKKNLFVSRQGCFAPFTAITIHCYVRSCERMCPSMEDFCPTLQHRRCVEQRGAIPTP